MSEKEPSDGKDRMVEAYERMLRHTHDRLEQAAQETRPAWKEMLEKARDHLVELGELTREEAAKVAGYIERDLQDAAAYLADTGEDVRQWWRFDLDLVEQRILDLFAAVADQSRMPWPHWDEQARRTVRYRRGEICRPGPLTCLACGAEVTLRKTGRIPSCPECGADAFQRTGRESRSGDET